MSDRKVMETLTTEQMTMLEEIGAACKETMTNFTYHTSAGVSVNFKLEGADQDTEEESEEE